MNCTVHLFKPHRHKDWKNYVLTIITVLIQKYKISQTETFVNFE